MFLYELHQHTKSCSKCASVTPAEMVLSVRECGFSGVVLTNHFYHGNSGIDRDRSWRDFCKAYEDEFYEAKNAGEKIGVDVIYGLEEHVGNGKVVLLYGIAPDFIAEYPELKEYNFPFLSEIVRSAGGLVIQAHPFRDRSWITDVDNSLDPTFVDGYELYNKNNRPGEDSRAQTVFADCGLIKTAGTDNHAYISSGRNGIAVSHRIKNEKELAKVLKSGDYELHTE